jgi:LDH2 family malate/lactate/ureidoglycolate dehydrogenase
MLALDVAAFLPPAEFAERMSVFAAMVRASNPADPSRPILMPGEPEQLIMTARRRDGIPLTDETVSELADLGARYRTPWDQGDAS